MVNWPQADYDAHLARMRGESAAPARPVPPVQTQPKVKISRRMNKWEEEYSRRLEVEKAMKLISWFGFEAVKLRLADATYYTPDFAVVDAQGELSFHEVKGHWRDDARVKFKVAAELFPFRFVALQKCGGKNNWGWQIIEDLRKCPVA